MEIKISRERLVERFLRYVSVDTQSDPQSETFPSTASKSYYGSKQDPDAYGRTHDLTVATGA